MWFFVRRGFLFLWVLGMGCVILLWHSLSLPYNYFSRAANSAVGGPIKPKFELVRALMHVIIACKNEKDQMKNSREKVETPFSHHNRICYNGNQCLDLAEFQTYLSSHVCYHYLQICKGSDQEQPRKSGDIIFPIISLWAFLDVQGQLTHQSVIQSG